MALLEEETQQFQQRASALVFDGLYCEEESFEVDDDDNSEIYAQHVRKETSLSSVLLEQDLFWDDDELKSLISKEKNTHFSFDNLFSDASILVARREAVEWILRVKSHYGLTALTCALAVNYFDRFLSRLRLHKDKPWMGQLTAVACLSLATKVEETQVLLLLDLQVEDSKFVFEAKTIKRMELLVLSTLQWRMHPVTPISFFDFILRRLGLKTHLHWEFLWKCERLLLSVISDSRFMGYLPSILATATMLHVIKEVEPRSQVEYQNHLMAVLQMSQDEVSGCCQLITELSGGPNQSHKRKHLSLPSSPNGVLDATLSCDSSNDSWSVESTVSASTILSAKRSRVQDLQMRLPLQNLMFADVLSSPH